MDNAEEALGDHVISAAVARNGDHFTTTSASTSNTILQGSIVDSSPGGLVTGSQAEEEQEESMVELEAVVSSDLEPEQQLLTHNGDVSNLDDMLAKQMMGYGSPTRSGSSVHSNSQEQMDFLDTDMDDRSSTSSEENCAEKVILAAAVPCVDDDCGIVDSVAACGTNGFHEEVETGIGFATCSFLKADLDEGLGFNQQPSCSSSTVDGVLSVVEKCVLQCEACASSVTISYPDSESGPSASGSRRFHSNTHNNNDGHLCHCSARCCDISLCGDVPSTSNSASANGRCYGIKNFINYGTNDGAGVVPTSVSLSALNQLNARTDNISNSSAEDVQFLSVCDDLSASLSSSANPSPRRRIKGFLSASASLMFSSPCATQNGFAATGFVPHAAVNVGGPLSGFLSSCTYLGGAPVPAAPSSAPVMLPSSNPGSSLVATATSVHNAASEWHKSFVAQHPECSHKIWSDAKSARQELPQLGPSSCGATAVGNVLKILLPNVNWNMQQELIAATVPTKLRQNNAPLGQYLLSRSVAGTCANDLILAVEKLSDGAVKGRFFHCFPRRDVSLINWISVWMKNDAVPVLTMNLQRGVYPGCEVPDAWHHQMVYASHAALSCFPTPAQLSLTNPRCLIDEQTLNEVLCSDSVLLVRAQDVRRRWDRENGLELLLQQPNPAWDELNVLGQVVNVIREDAMSPHFDPQSFIRVSHVSIPCAYKSGVTLFARSNSRAWQLLAAAPELPILCTTDCADVSADIAKNTDENNSISFSNNNALANGNSGNNSSVALLQRELSHESSFSSGSQSSIGD